MEPVTHTATAGACSSTLSAPTLIPQTHTLQPTQKLQAVPLTHNLAGADPSVRAPTTLLWCNPGVNQNPTHGKHVVQHQKAAHRPNCSHLSHPAPTRPIQHAQFPTHLPAWEQQVTAENTPIKPLLYTLHSYVHMPSACNATPRQLTDVLQKCHPICQCLNKEQVGTPQHSGLGAATLYLCQHSCG